MAMWFSKPKPQSEALFFDWSNAEQSVGITMFDQEHRELAALMSQIHSTLKTNHDRALGQKLLESLIYETWAHFEHEERVMEEVGFPEREAHAAEHAILIREAKELLQKFKGGVISALALPNFLKTWLIPHIQTMDRRYAACMRRQGHH